MDAVLVGLEAIWEFEVLLSLLAGSMIGLAVGALPGIGPAVAISLLLPITYSMSPLVGLGLLLGIYCGSYYGGAIPAILINTPGTPAAIVTAFDGYPMAKRGQATRALNIAFLSSFIGGMASIAALSIVAPLLSAVTEKFGAAEYAASAVLALVLVILGAQGRMLAAAMMVGLGLFLSTIGLDSNTLQPRFTFGTTELLGGLPLVPMVIGLFGVAQAFCLLESSWRTESIKTERTGIDLEAFRDMASNKANLARSSSIGIVFGILPGIGAVMSSYVAYLVARWSSQNRDMFQKGSPEGLIASESANNAVTGAALIPVLTLGIPGDAITALMMGVFIIHNVFPGPLLIAERPDLVYGIFFAMIVINFILIVISLTASGLLSRLIQIPQNILAFSILALSFVGTYSISSSYLNVWIAFFAGIFGYFCRRNSFPLVGLILGIILGPLLEQRMWQSLSISEGSFLLFLERPISLAIVTLTLALIAGRVYSAFFSSATGGK